MQEDNFRTAFTFGPILRHRTADVTRRITAISFDTAAERIFLGLASGHVEEHQIFVKQAHVDAVWQGSAHSNPSHLAPGNLASTRLVAEKRVSRQPVSSLFCLPTAARLAILSEDGTVVVAAYDTWTVTALQGVRTAIAMAADPGPAATAAALSRQNSDITTSSNASPLPTGKPPPPAVSPTVGPSPRPVRLAVAVKSITTAAKLLVYSIAPAIGFAAGQPPAQLLAQIPLADPVTNLIWVGSGLFVQHPTSYNLLLPGGRVTQIAEHGCRQPRMASAPWPSGPSAAGAIADGSAVGNTSAAAAAARGALLFQDSLLVLTDGNGTAVVGSEPIPVSESPLGIASSGPYMVLVSDADGGLLVYDRVSSRLVQRIDWAHDDPWVAAARRIPVTEDASGGGGVVVATSNVVMLLQPVAPDMQARELLKRKRFDAALALIRSCRRAGEQWADTALAQAGLLLLQELRCEDALTAFDEVGTDTFQPAQLLALFPRWCRRWLPALPLRQYWGLHGSLQSLDRLCEDFLELRRSTSSSPRPSNFTSAPLQGTPGTAPVAPQPPPYSHMHPDSNHPPTNSGRSGVQVLSPDPHALHHNHHHNHHYNHHHQPPQHHNHQSLSSRGGSAGGGLDGVAVTATGFGAMSIDGGSWIPVLAYGSGSSNEVAGLALDAKRHITSYLLRTRGSPGVQCLDGIDFLLTQLLLDTGETSQLETFLGARGLGATAGGPEVSASASTSAAAACSSSSAAAVVVAGLVDGGEECGGVEGPEPPAAVSPRDPTLVAALESAGRVHALAVLRAARGQVSQALELWQRLALGEAVEAPSASGAVAAAAAAAAESPSAPSAPSAAAAATSHPLTAMTSSSSLPSSLPPSSTRASHRSVVPLRPPPATAVLRSPAPASAPSHSGGLPLDGSPPPPLAALQAPYDSGCWAAAAAAVAAASAACLMAQPGRTLPLLCLSKLPWLLGIAPHWALHVLRSRPLPVADVIALLQARTDGVRWQYLHHLVYDYSSMAAAHSPVSSGAKVARNADGTATAEVESGDKADDGHVVGADSASVVGPIGGSTGDGDGGHAGAGDPVWHLEPSLHTELALELVECIATLMLQQQREKARRRQEQHQGERREQEERGQRGTASEQQQQGEQQQQPQQLPLQNTQMGAQLGVDGASGAVPSAAALCTTSVLPMSAAMSTSAAAAAARGADAVGPLAELPPALPPLSRPSAGVAAATAATHSEGAVVPTMTSTASRAGSPVWVPSAVQDTGSLTAGEDRTQQRPWARQHSATLRSEQSHVVHCVCSPRRPAAAADGGGAACPSTADLAWLGTIGSLTPAAVVRYLKLAVRAAMVAVGRDPDAAAADAAASSDQGAGNGAGGSSDSLSLLRALSRRGDGRGIGSVDGLRAVLQHHLYCSTLYDAGIVLQAISSSPAAPLLTREAVQLHCQLGDHTPALALLALQMTDVEAAIGYCRVRCGKEGWFALLDLLLRPPGADREPDYSAACRVLAAEGAAMAPLQVLEALSDDMPLHLAAHTLSRMMGSVQHRKRHGQVLRALHRAQNLGSRCELAQLQTARVVVNEETLCRGCQRPLSTRVFYRYPTGVVLCARCVRPDLDTPAGQSAESQQRVPAPGQPLTRR